MRLIDADALGNRLYHEVFEKDSEDQRWDSGCWMRYKLFEKVLREQPTVEQPEIIRCRDCKLRDTEYCNMAHGFMGLKDDDYCSYAERREDNK
jgi:hypothetical protein